MKRSKDTQLLKRHGENIERMQTDTKFLKRSDFKTTLMFAACLFVPAIFVALFLPEHKTGGEPVATPENKAA